MNGELTGVALEIPAKVTVTFELKKGYSINWPRIVTEEFILGLEVRVLLMRQRA